MASNKNATEKTSTRKGTARTCKKAKTSARTASRSVSLKKKKTATSQKKSDTVKKSVKAATSSPAKKAAKTAPKPKKTAAKTAKKTAASAKKSPKKSSSPKAKTANTAAKKTSKVAIKVKKPDEKDLEKKKKLEEQRAAREEKKKLESALSDSLARQMLIDLGGENALTIIRNFSKGLSDDDIAKKLKLKISDVRATLNRLHSEGIVNYVRARDSETGWYSYSWSLDRYRMEKWITEQAQRYAPMQRQDGEYYFCPSCGVPSIMDFETATDYSFRCHRCNKSMEYVDDAAFDKLNEIYKRKI